jgi:hypothetical protein
MLCCHSCEVDNYDGPDAQIAGRIIDHNGNLLRTEPGSSNMRIRMDELSWAKGDTSIAVIPRYLNVKIDGTYVNTKIFSGTYRMLPVEGAFYPYDEDEADTIDIKGSVTKDFVVTPYLDVNWVDEPHLTTDSCVEASVCFVRNAKEGVFMPDLLNARLCISSNQYVGNNNYYTDIISGAVAVTNAQENTTIVLKSKKLKYFNTDVFVRVGVCCDDAYKKYNYTTIIRLHIP